MNNTVRDDPYVPVVCQNRRMEDDVHEFNAYVDKGYCWISITHLPSKKIVAVASIKIQKGWKQLLFCALGHACTKYRNREPERQERAARFYRSDFVAK
jgi:hypothetical protein